jgi:hypothetical protein
MSHVIDLDELSRVCGGQGLITRMPAQLPGPPGIPQVPARLPGVGLPVGRLPPPPSTVRPPPEGMGYPKYSWGWWERVNSGIVRR